MTDLYLIAHCVRGEPAFDVAQRMDCPECPRPTEYWGDGGEMHQGPPLGCNECDQLGYWWIIGTSGHRAYPMNDWPLSELFWSPTESDPKIPITYAAEAIMAKDMSHLPDHYPTSATPSRTLADLLGITNRPQVSTAPFPRRI